MAHLVPYPLGRLAGRVLRELEAGGPVLDYPRAKVVRGLPGRDLTTSIHGHLAATPLGPAAGPHTQLAQNILLAFLGGSRVFELKTVQVMDELVIPRPCIDMRTVGFNVEWSQELKLEQSLEEYVKASMLLDVAIASGQLGLAPGFERYVFDLSVGYDLKGIRGERVQAFLNGMKNAQPTIDRLRKELPAKYRDLPFRTGITDTLTLSTFHGCPPGEIEGIAKFLMEENGLHVVVKLNPTLLGPTDGRRLFNERLGYRYRIPDSAFANDPTFEQAGELITRLEEVAKRSGRTLGVKFSNTLVVENEGDFLPKAEKLSYLSGPPLHVLAMTLVARFRAAFGDRLPVSFSAGLDKFNFPDAVALGLKPVTVCSDLLRTGGYARAHGYFAELEKRMAAVGAASLDEFTLKAHGQGEAALAKVPGLDAAACRESLAPGGSPLSVAGPMFENWVSEARLLNTRHYAGRLPDDKRYHAAQNAKAPNKVGSHLVLFDCLTCDKCVPVCPNHANFTYTLPKAELPIVKLTRANGAWAAKPSGTLKVEEKHQIGNFADFCNECGNCDVFCPEDGGPYVLKPRFFGSAEQFAKWKSHDGFFVAQGATLGRFGGKEFRLEASGARTRFSGAGFELELDPARPESPTAGKSDEGVEVDLTYFHILRWLRDAVLDPATSNYLNS